MRISDWSSDVCSSDLSGANLDVDGRFRQIAETGVRALIRCIEWLLEKHQRVIVRNNPGNHDPHQAAMLSICLAARFHDNPRVTIDDSPSSRSEERRVGKECVSTCRSRWWPQH